MQDLLRPLVILSAFLAAALSQAQEPKIPETAPPAELVGRWLEKTSEQKGEFAGYNVYLFSRKSEFLVLSRVRNEQTKTWVSSNKLYAKERPSLPGYFEVKTPGLLHFDIVALGTAVLPLEMKYSVQGQTLTLSKSIFDPTSGHGVKCERVDRLPGESAEEAAAVKKRIEGDLNGPDFRQAFESAAHEMKEHPSDDAMIANFDDHREEFEALRLMMQEDKQLRRVDYDHFKPEDLTLAGITAERLEQYRALCKKLGLERGVEALSDDATRIALMASCRGLSISGSCKTYVWLIEPPVPMEGRAIVTDLDAYVRKRKEERSSYFKAHKRVMPGHANAYRHIEGNWYLQYED